MFFDFISQTYAYREYLKQSVMRDLRTRYKRSFLGYLWTMLHPLAMMTILAVVFSHIMRIPIKDYAVFLFAGLLPWNYFQTTTLMALGTMKNNARIYSQIAVPKYIFILSLTFSNLINFILALVPLLVIMLAVGRSIPLTVLAFPVVLLPLFCIVVGLGLTLSTLNVFFDDTAHLTDVALQALYFLSPILYQRTMVPAGLVQYLILNPLFCQIEFMRGLFYDGVLPDPATFLVNFAGSVLILAFGLMIFRKNEDKFLYFV